MPRLEDRDASVGAASFGNNDVRVTIHGAPEYIETWSKVSNTRRSECSRALQLRHGDCKELGKAKLTTAECGEGKVYGDDETGARHQRLQRLQ
jgi:hypothetical protein